MKCLLTAIVIFGGLVSGAMAESPKSLLPPFGNAGAEFVNKNAQPGYEIHGWLPKHWIDNSGWAQVSAIYSKLTDSPDKDAGAVRIEIKKVDRGQLQVTSWEGFEAYTAGTKYVVTGWVRSPLLSTVKIGFRDDEEPRPFYDQKDLVTGGEWKRFEYVFTPEKDCKASLMFVVKEPGIIDLAGVVLAEKP